LLAAYEDAKENYYLGGLRLSAVEGGRFCEAAFRVLQEQAFGTYDPVGTPLDTEKCIRNLASRPAASLHESIRIHIPRALRVVYDIRNNRDAAHLADGIDPNVQDATLVIGILDWVLAELVRLYHNIPPNDAQDAVEDLVTRKAPTIQDFSGFLKVLNPRLSASDHCLVLLYQVGSHGASYSQLQDWARPSMRSNLRKTLSRLVDKRALVHFDGALYRITRTGQQYVERKAIAGGQ
jgi:hypothetical protein